MLSAAYDLLKQISHSNEPHHDHTSPTSPLSISNFSDANRTLPYNQVGNTSYCNEHSTSTILLADTLPSLATKIVYPVLLVGVPTFYKAIATALLTAVAFIITGLSSGQVLIFIGVVCASLSSGIGESTYLSHTPLYGDVSLSGWSMGTGAAGVVGAASYALLTMYLSIKLIMLMMLVVPAAMLVAYFYIVQPVDEGRGQIGDSYSPPDASTQVVSSLSQDEETIEIANGSRGYGANDPFGSSIRRVDSNTQSEESFNFRDKIQYLPSLAKYFLPLLLVYFAEYFINQGLFELIYYPEITKLDHPAQYRWFQVSYQVGVMISRSSLDLFRIKNLWAMSILQVVNALIFLAHASKLIHIPSFYIVIFIIIYEGLLGGFTYVNTFFRVKKEVKPDRREFCISTVTIADSLGIVMAAIVALPTHEALCQLYM